MEGRLHEETFYILSIIYLRNYRRMARANRGRFKRNLSHNLVYLSLVNSWRSSFGRLLYLAEGDALSAFFTPCLRQAKLDEGDTVDSLLINK